ncbi:unnamed protein product [Allacma fusca]|uniref:Uncharacterized protein n=1 Tax=Allacma fusca TaxID=39272 RepID=A0A8J2K519_9HEXA|nr:unnamed protein product [Allacma fusca]
MMKARRTEPNIELGERHEGNPRTKDSHERIDCVQRKQPHHFHQRPSSPSLVWTLNITGKSELLSRTRTPSLLLGRQDVSRVSTTGRRPSRNFKTIHADKTKLRVATLESGYDHLRHELGQGGTPTKEKLRCLISCPTQSSMTGKKMLGSICDLEYETWLRKRDSFGVKN